jgi:hypothetical protein
MQMKTQRMPADNEWLKPGSDSKGHAERQAAARYRLLKYAYLA